MDALRSRGEASLHVRATGYVQVIVDGRAQPKVKTLFHWMQTPQGLRMRLTGFGPLGITVFDGLMRDGSVYLFVPSHDRVYIGHPDDVLTPGQSLEGLLRKAGWIMNPWSVVFQPNSEAMGAPSGGRCGTEVDCACLVFDAEPGVASACFSRQTLAPEGLIFPDLEVDYGPPLALPDGQPFPSRFTLNFRTYPLVVDLLVREIEDVPAGSENGSFDPAPFLEHPSEPLPRLLEGLRRQ